MENNYWPADQESAALWNHCQNDQADDTFMVPWLPSAAAPQLQHYDYRTEAVAPWMSGYEVDEHGGAAGGSKSHSEAEKRRRDRINDRLATLRKLIPKSEKMDKAALLGHVVEQVQELNAKAKECSDFSNIPSEIDEVNVDFINEGSNSNGENVFINASVCCNDRPEMYAELSSAFKELGLTIIEGDLTSLGGRTRGTFVLCAVQNPKKSTNALRHSIKLVLNKVAFSSATPNFCPRSKRQRFFFNDT